MSLLNQLSTLGNAFDLYLRIKGSEDFAKLVQRIQQDSIEKVTVQTVENTLLRLLDENVTPILEDPDLNRMFNNQALTKTEQVKLVLGRGTKLVYDTMEDYIKRYIRIEEDTLVSLGVRELIEYVDVDEVECLTDIYRQLVNKLSMYISAVVLTGFMASQTYMPDLHEYIDTGCKAVVDVMDYRTPNVGSKRPRDDDDNGDDENPPKRR